MSQKQCRLVGMSEQWPGFDLKSLGSKPFGTVLADPPWRFLNRTGKVAPEHKRLARYDTLTSKEIAQLPVGLLKLRIVTSGFPTRFWAMDSW